MIGSMSAGLLGWGSLISLVIALPFQLLTALPIAG